VSTADDHGIAADPRPAGGASPSWIAHVVVACVGGVALAGMFIGFNDTVTPTGQPGFPGGAAALAPADPASSIPGAVVYSEMTGARFGPNAGWRSPWPAPASNPVAIENASPPAPDQTAAALAQRTQRRAFSGAPPVVPHAIDQKSAASCLVCHGEGMRVGQVVAPRMSHEMFANCTQCHVESSNRALPPTRGPRAAATLFEGLDTPGPGERAWPGAPPMIPHTTWMRENCISCHGEFGHAGLRTSHPWRSNCTQCHAPSAALDQWQVPAADRPPVVAPWDNEQ
jgi:cytochrome c-type protein NapB